MKSYQGELMHVSMYACMYRCERRVCMYICMHKQSEGGVLYGELPR